MSKIMFNYHSQRHSYGGGKLYLDSRDRGGTKSDALMATTGNSGLTEESNGQQVWGTARATARALGDSKANG